MYREGHGPETDECQGRMEPMVQSGEGWYSFSAHGCIGLRQIAIFCRRSAALASYMHYQGFMEGATMAQTKRQLVRELNHEIHSPLAAIRNALYLAAVRNSDPATLRYLELADAEISRIAGVLRKANQTHENKRVHLLVPSILPVTAA